MLKTPAPNWGTAPFCCVTGRAVDDDGFYRTEMTLGGHDPIAHISASGVRLLAKAEGWTSPEDAAVLRAEIADLTSALDVAVAEISELRKIKEGIEGLAASGFELSRKTGRPPKSTEQPEIRKEIEKKMEKVA